MNKNFTEEISGSKTAFIEVSIAALLLSLNASLVASIIYEKSKPNLLLLGFGSALFIIIGLLILAKRVGKARSAKLHLVSFFILDTKNNSLLDIPRYRFGESLYSFFKAAFKENTALKRQWDVGKISRIATQSSSPRSEAYKLIEEATEYFILESLSSHLTDYFNDKKYSDKGLKEYTRKDIPDILLSNRFMELFSNSMENRAIFPENSNIPEHGEVVYAISKDGGIYSKFDLTLPIKTKICRDKNGIFLDTEYFTLRIQNSFDGYGFVTPRGFEKYYLGLNRHDHREYQIKVDVEVKFKMKSLFANAKWDYHSWLDGFLTSLSKSMDAKVFFNKIQWELAYTMLQCGEISKRTNNGNASDNTGK